MNNVNLSTRLNALGVIRASPEGGIPSKKRNVRKE